MLFREVENSVRYSMDGRGREWAAMALMKAYADRGDWSSAEEIQGMLKDAGDPVAVFRMATHLAVLRARSNYRTDAKARLGALVIEADRLFSNDGQMRRATIATSGSRASRASRDARAPSLLEATRVAAKISSRAAIVGMRYFAP